MEILGSGKIAELNGEEKDIDPGLKTEVEDFLDAFGKELGSMGNDAFRNRYGTIMGNLFAEAEYEP